MSLLPDIIGRGPLTSRPAAGSAGRLWYDTTNSQMTRDNGTAWEICEPTGLAPSGTAGGDLAGTFPNPTVSQQSSRLPVKASVRVAATANVTVSSPGTAIDGVTLTSGDRVLLTAQTAGSENGIYVFNGSTSALTRDTDASAAAQFVSGFQVYVREGTSNGAKTFVHTTSGTITLGTTALTFVALGSGGGGGGGTPSILLDYTLASDVSISNQTTALTDVIGNQSFTVASSSSRVEIAVRCSAMLGTGTGGTQTVLVVDSAGTPVTKYLGGGYGLTSQWVNPFAGCGSVFVSGLSAGSHTVKLQYEYELADATKSFNCRPATRGAWEHLSIQVIEHP